MVDSAVNVVIVVDLRYAFIIEYAVDVVIVVDHRYVNMIEDAVDAVIAVEHHFVSMASTNPTAPHVVPTWRAFMEGTEQHANHAKKNKTFTLEEFSLGT